MKRTYVKPSTTAFALCAESMLAASLTINNNDDTTVSAGDALSRENSGNQWDTTWE